jgi:hypothetical protein
VDANELFVHARYCVHENAADGHNLASVQGACPVYVPRPHPPMMLILNVLSVIVKIEGVGAVSHTDVKTTYPYDDARLCPTTVSHLFFVAFTVGRLYYSSSDLCYMDNINATSSS